ERLNQLLSEHTETALMSRWRSALAAIETMPSDEVPLRRSPTFLLRFNRKVGRILRLLRRLISRR
ncbi:MAG: glycosyltransferase, partial [Gammaproteobacteria bacterium]|nr:glycosyltransferase [Gammaproteobacteria bacterium]